MEASGPRAVALGLALLTAGVAVVGTAGANHEDGASYGTLVAEDPAGDTLGPTPWLDIRELWFASDGTELTITLVLKDLRENQPLDSYEVEFFNDRDEEAGALGSNKDRLQCDLGSMEPERSECRYLYMLPEGGNEFREVPFTVDPEADTIQATISYHHLHAQPTETLRGIEARSEYDAEVMVGAQVAEDDAEAAEPYELAAGPEDFDPTPEPLVAWDPAQDTRTGADWLDLRQLELASDGEEMTVTIQLEDLHRDQRADRYDVEFTDGSEPSASTVPGKAPVDNDELTCRVGGDAFASPGCEYTRRDAGGERVSEEVPMEVDFEQGTVAATVPYGLVGLGPGEELEVLRAVSWVNAAVTAVGDDTMTVDRTYQLAGEEPEPDPDPVLGDPLATDPPGDTRSGKSWLDLRALWIDSDGQQLTATLELQALREGQYADRYDVEFTDGSEPSASEIPGVDPVDNDELTCNVADGPFKTPGCEYTRRDAGGERVSEEVPMEVDLVANTITATVPYELLGLETGEGLEVLQAVSWTQAAYTSTSEDEMEVGATHVLE